MVNNGEHSEREEFAGAQIQILGTDAAAPDEGRIFVWTKMGWFERLEGPSGDVAFSFIADSEEELKELISRENSQAELYELDGQFRKLVSGEFIEQSQSYSDSPDDISEESDDDDQAYHQHG